jgi:hypothetical protein
MICTSAAPAGDADPPNSHTQLRTRIRHTRSISPCMFAARLLADRKATAKHSPAAILLPALRRNLKPATSTGTMQRCIIVRAADGDSPFFFKEQQLPSMPSHILSNPNTCGTRGAGKLCAAKLGIIDLSAQEDCQMQASIATTAWSTEPRRRVCTGETSGCANERTSRQR